MERTFILAKPDAMQRALLHQIIKRFEVRGYQLVAMKLVPPPSTPAIFERHYEHLRGRPFFNRMMTYMMSGPVCAMVWQGPHVVEEGRKILGATYQADWRPGTIRGDYCTDVERSVCHAADSVENAAREIELWFPTLM